MATNGDELCILNDRSVRQGHILTALLDGKSAVYAEETKQINFKVTGRLEGLSLVARQGQGQGVTIAAGINA